MASIKKSFSPPLFPLLLPILILSLSATTTAAIPTSSLDSLLSLLRTSGHSLFANAISTSDLLFDLLPLPSFTLLIPPNPSLFALDLALPSPSYLSSLRLHVIPNYSLPLTNTVTTAAAANHTSTTHPLTLRTLNPSRVLHVTTSPLTGTILIDGVELLSPPLYLSRNVTVYRIRGTMPAQVSSPPHRRESHNRTVRPHLARPVPANRTSPAPVNPRNRTDRTPIQRNQTDLAPAPPPVNVSVLALSPVNYPVASLVPNNTPNIKDVETGSPSPLVENRPISAPLAPVSSGLAISHSEMNDYDIQGKNSGVSTVENEERCGPLDGKNMQCSNRDPTPIQPNQTDLASAPFPVNVSVLAPAPLPVNVSVLAPAPLLVNVSVLAPSPANNPVAFPVPNNTANSTDFASDSTESTDRTDVGTGLPVSAPFPPITSGFMISNFEMSDYDGEGEISGVSSLSTVENEERCGPLDGKSVHCNDQDGDGDGEGRVSTDGGDDYLHRFGTT